MKKWILSMSAALLLLPTVWGQVSDPATYPIQQSPETEQTRDMARQFEETNVGNLHVFATLAEADEVDHQYYFKGRPLAESFHSLLPRKWYRQLSRDRMDAYAVYQIRGEGEAYFIIRFDSPRHGQQIELFDLENGRLVHKMNLAGIDCNRNICRQTDSWVIDIDGDTRLDIIQKSRRYRPGTAEDQEIVREKTTIYAQRQDGSFDATDNLRAPISTFVMKDLGE